MSIMLRAYKFRLYPNKEQQEYFAKCFGCVRFILRKEFTQLKKTNVVKNSYVNTGVSVLPSDIRILRMDNLKMTSRIVDCCNG